MPWMPFQGTNAALEQYFTVVHWDQRGAGKSYHPSIPPESMTIEQLLQDAKILIDRLCAEFNQKQVILVGFSCGSLLGALLCQRHPELINAYIGMGQVADFTQSEPISYQQVLAKAKESGHKKALRELAEIGDPPYKNHRAMLIQRKWVNKFGGFFHLREQRVPFYKSAFLSNEYSLTDLGRVYRGVDFSAHWLWPQFYQVNLFDQAPAYDMPVAFFHGVHDAIVPSDTTKAYFEMIKAPQKHWVDFEHAAHWPMLEDPKVYHQAVLSFLGSMM
jgi:pimeloyl-ACP methyl ester carboxylesterase